MRDGKHVILCVDDDADCLEVLRTVLEAHGYHFEGAAGAQEALEVYRRTEPDLIIVDLMMEEVDAGTRLVRDLKADGCRAPIYLLSAVGDMLHRNVDATQLGLDGVFQKPLDPKHLVATLDTRLKGEG